jgi:hypothetical protein
MYKEIDKEESDIKDEVFYMTSHLLVCDAPNKPGAWIKKWGNHFKHLKDFKAKHFQDIRPEWFKK